MDFKVTFAAQAERDLFAIVRFLAQKNLPLLAGWVTLCSTRPYRSHKCANRGAVVQARPGVRKLAHRPYHLIFHRVDESRRLVEIARFWDGRQDPSLLKME